METKIPMRIAHVMAGARHGGAELFFERLCAAQHRRGHDVRALFRYDQARFDRLTASGVASLQFPFKGVLDWRTRGQLSRTLTTMQPHVAIAWMNRAAKYLPQGPWQNVGRLGGYYDLRYYAGCEHLIGNTRALQRWIAQQGWPKERVHYLPNFANDYALVAPQRPDFLPRNVPFILALGRLHPNKGFDVLIRALRHVERAHVVIAGEGGERAKLRALAKAENVAERVHLPGWIDDCAPWLRACDVFVCPSRIEPLGNVVIEAFSAARPVIASAIQGPLEIMHGTQDGLLVGVEEPVAFAEAINAVLADPTRALKLATNARARFEREFSASSVLEQWDHFLQKVGSGACAG